MKTPVIIEARRFTWRIWVRDRNGVTWAADFDRAGITLPTEHDALTWWRTRRQAFRPLPPGSCRWVWPKR